jgi:hypothetical protein
MDWVFQAFVAAAVIHVLEEYVFPGGFLDTMKSFNSGFAPFIPVKSTVIINALFLLWWAAGAVIASRNL